MHRAAVARKRWGQRSGPGRGRGNRQQEAKHGVVLRQGIVEDPTSDQVRVKKRLETFRLGGTRRTRAGKFGIEKALTLEELEKVVAEDRLADHLIAMNEAVGHLPSVTLNAERAAKTKSGLSTRVDADSIPNRADVRIVDESGALLAIGTFDSDESRVQPRIVLV